MNKDLLEQIRRSLARDRARPRPGSVEQSPAAAPLPRELLLAGLRHELERIERRSRPAGRADAPPAATRADPKGPPATLPCPPTAPLSASLPDPLDAEGQIYRQVLALPRSLGRAVIEYPDAGLLDQVARVVELDRPGTLGRPTRAEEILFFDLETTGLSRSAETIAFLIGLGRFREDTSFEVTQIFLSDLAQEPLALERLQGFLDGARLLVSFNGRSFDAPLLESRALLTRTFLDLGRKPHLDLLPICRRLFRGRLSSCRLVALERELLGFERTGDIDGAEAPRIYLDYLRSGRLGELPLILEHNRLDVATMAPLLARVVRHATDPLRWAEDAEELLATGLWHLRARRGTEALGETCLRRGLELARRLPARRRLLVALARHLGRTRRADEASRLWEELRREEPGLSTGWVELAKYHEHVTRDLRVALELTEQCPMREREDLTARRERLLRRVTRERGG